MKKLEFLIIFIVIFKVQLTCSRLLNCQEEKYWCINIKTANQCDVSLTIFINFLIS